MKLSISTLLGILLGVSLFTSAIVLSTKDYVMFMSLASLLTQRATIQRWSRTVDDYGEVQIAGGLADQVDSVLFEELGRTLTPCPLLPTTTATAASVTEAQRQHPGPRQHCDVDWKHRPGHRQPCAGVGQGRCDGRGGAHG